MVLLEKTREVAAEVQAPRFGKMVRVEMRREVGAGHDGGAHDVVAEKVQRRVEVVDLRASSSFGETKTVSIVFCGVGSRVCSLGRTSSA